jgi:hypothetical protein
MDVKIEKLKDIIQDCNINFLLGSGMSAEYLNTLGSIEALLAEVEGIKGNDKRSIIRASLYKKYFDGVIEKNLNILNGDDDTISLMNNYKNFFEIFNKILLERKSTLLSKQINIFTTNIDICLEKALEDKSFEYNDGFVGSFKPKFDLSNFKKTLFKSSLHFENISELPVFNIYKIHGSLTWKTVDTNIYFSHTLKLIKNISEVKIDSTTLVDIDPTDTIESLKIKASRVTCSSSEINNFKRKYEKLSIVNPTKDKFKETILNQTYYELLRIYSNELEKDNSILFVLGFSFADEHIRDLTLRVANSNPTLIIYIIAYDKSSYEDLKSKFIDIKYNNIEIVSPEKNEDKTDNFTYTFQAINTKIFKKLEKSILEG